MPRKHKLYGARIDKLWTQRELSVRSGVSESTISRIENHRGPDVPASQRHKTKTRFSTVLKLVAAMLAWASDDYSLEEVIAYQTLFTPEEIYEAARLLQGKMVRGTRDPREIVATYYSPDDNTTHTPGRSRARK